MPLNLGRRRFLGAMRPLFAGLRSVPPLGDVLIVAAVYFAAAKLGLSLACYHPSATPVWPPTGIALASMLLLGYRAGPGIFLGAFLANLTTYGTVWTSLSIATGNTLEGLVGTYLVNKYANSNKVFDHPRDIFKFALLAAVLSTAVSATIGVTSLALGGFARGADYRLVWLTWWLGDATGALIFAPLLILYGRDLHLRWSGQAMLERGLFLVALLSISWLVFGGQFPFVYLTVPFLVWAALRFDQRETAAVVVLLTLIAVWATSRHLGPFVGATPNESLLLLQAFVGTPALVPEEFGRMKTHVKVGAGMLSEGRSDLLRLAEEIALTHHERWDGTGYPVGLRGEAVPLSGRIVAVADVFDAIISTRPYRKARSIEEAIKVIENGAGTQFDPRVVDALMAHVDRAPSRHFADAGKI